MSDKQVMEISILPNGEVKIQVKCVPGAACEAVSKAIEESLGTVKTRERTAEYYQESEDQTQTVGRG
jgi:hypothetical protein